MEQYSASNNTDTGDLLRKLNILMDFPENATIRDYIEKWMQVIKDEVDLSNEFIRSVNYKKDAWENQRNEATEASNRISQLIEKKKYVEKRAKKTEERTIEAANKIDTVNKELLNILKNDDIAEKLYDEAREQLVKDREEISDLRKQVLSDLKDLETDFKELEEKVNRCDFFSEEYLDDYTLLKWKTCEIKDETEELSETLNRKLNIN